MYDEIICLIKRSPVNDASGRPVLDSSGRHKISETSREVFCRQLNIGMKEFYQASAVDRHPEAKVALPDYLDYEGEALADYNGQRYSILRTYRVGNELELTLERAAKEEGAAYG